MKVPFSEAFKQLSIREKLALLFISTTVVALASGLIFVIVTTVTMLKHELLQDTLIEARIAGDFAVTDLSSGDRAKATKMLSAYAEDPKIIAACIYDKSGHVFATHSADGFDFEPPPAQSKGYTFQKTELHIFHEILNEGEKYGSIFIAASTSELQKKIWQSAITMIAIWVGLGVFFGFVAFWVQGIISEPILRLAETARRISDKGDYRIRVERTTDDEIGMLYDGFNEMLGQILMREHARDHAEEQLRISEERFRTLFESAPIATIAEDFSKVKSYLDSLDLEARQNPDDFLKKNEQLVKECALRIRIIDVNRRAVELYKAPDKDALLEHLDSSLREKYSHVLARQIVAILQCKSESQFEDRVQIFDGEILDVAIRWSVPASYENTLGQVLVTFQDITERKRAEEALQKSEELYRTLVENAPNVITTIDRDGTITFINRTSSQLSPQEVIGKNLYDFLPEEDRKSVSTNIEAVFRSGQSTSFESRTGQGADIHRYTNRVGATKHEGKIVAATIISTDITERKRAEEQIVASLEEKEVLLKEIHHRVKNNMQLISSLLNLQAQQVRDAATQDVLLESRNRVRSMALIHEKLYQTKDFAQVDFKDYLRNLSSSLFRTYSINAQNIELQVRAEDVFLTIEQAIPCGLIINELLTNSLIHGFPNGRSGQIEISLCASSNEAGTDGIELSVVDSGVGFPDNFNYNNTKSLGLQIVNTLVKQLDGELSYDNGNGASFAIRFHPAV